MGVIVKESLLHTSPGLPIPVVDLIAEAFSSALGLAHRYAGATSPNPPVGCVILSADGRVLASEAHQRAGAPHAEVAAISACQRARCLDQIDTIIVTLEPCNHFGRTPPCTQAILSTPARSLWIAAQDPNPRVAGGGAKLLEERGIRVRMLGDLDHAQTPHLVKSAQRLIAPFAKWSACAQPWISIKTAITRQGSMIPPANQKTFTSKSSLVFAHQLRKRADAIITGSGTILADNPEFTVRHVQDHRDKQRHLAILDRRGRVPKRYLEEARARGFHVTLEQDLGQMLMRLGKEAVIEALVEAGPQVLASFLDQKLWDEKIIIEQSEDPQSPDRIVIETRLPTPN